MSNIKYLIVGLGNPGKEYEGTRHNIGFMVLDKIAGKSNAGKFIPERKLKGELIKTKMGESEVILFKPNTFMNLSGEAHSLVANYFRISPDKTIVISDDANLELGQVRVRFAGEAGGHKGLDSIITHSGIEFWRIRVGISQNKQIPLEDYVLQKFSNDEKEVIADSIDKTAFYLIESIIKGKLENKTL